MEAADGTRRVVIEGVKPEIDAGRFPIKRTVGEQVVVEADLFADGHDALSGRLLYRRAGDGKWSESPLEPLVNDRWRGAFRVTELGSYGYTLEGWVDRFKTWTRDLAKRVEAEQDVAVELLIGAALVEDAATRATGADATELQAFGRTLRAGGGEAVAAALSAELGQLMARHADRGAVTRYERELPVTVDRERARFSTWYELFPRSTAATKPGWRLQPDGEEGGSGRHPQTPARGAPLNPRGGDGEDPPARGAPLDPRGGMSAEAPALPHGTLRDVQDWLPYVAAMGFDVLYLPPIHPIGRAFRKGRNNALEAAPGDPGSPWAIGGPEGGHDAVHPELGTLDDFRELVERARGFGLEVALDVAFQCSPDHPYVREHPEWFRQRPDGTIQYAENPPKKYQDIYPFDFENPDWRGLWDELTRVTLFWVEQGVRIFRVDNPHTKPFAFWEQLIREVKRQHPEVIFLAEAFTRPKVTYRLAKLGFAQSYTYFAWRQTPAELVAYCEELTRGEPREFFRPNFWPNTPDILTEQLQLGGKAMFQARVALAATLSASYGIYGPAYELCEARPREPGSEEYLDSEKYEIRRWDWDAPDSLRDFIARLNRIRREHPALQRNDTLRFHPVDNDYLLAYSKSHGEDTILCVVNTDPHHPQAGWVQFGVGSFQVHNLLSDARYLWHGPRNYVELSPAAPVRIFEVRQRSRQEAQFEYY